MSYKHFSEKEIYAIEIYLEEWKSNSEIWRKLWRSHSSVWRLINDYWDKEQRRLDWDKCLREKKEKRKEANKNNKTRIKDDNLKIFIIKQIKRYWSPEQIAWRWNEETWENLSKDTVYNYIYKNYPELIKKYFRRKWKKYQHNKKEKYNLTWWNSIELRDKVVEERSRIWDWEWDTIVWSRWWSKEVILTNVDRKSWFLLASKIKDKSWNSVLYSTLKLFKNIPKYKKLTMTYDNWREFSQSFWINYYTWLNVYFAHTYSSWERWTNENTNWLIRQFIPKKTDFENISQNQLKYFVSLINSRPRKRLNYKTPFEVFFSKSLNLCTSF